MLRMTTRAGALAIAAASLVAGAACTTDPTAVAPADDAANTGDAGASTFANTACGTCVSTTCSESIAACQTNSECPAWIDCMLGCPVDAAGLVDEACIEACPTGSSSESKKLAAAVNACRTLGAGATCDGCGAASGDGPKTPTLNQTCPASSDTTACFICQDEHCCETIAACRANADCGELKTCLAGCGSDAQCTKDCAVAHPSGAAEFGKGVGCAIYHCGIEQKSCDAGDRDACEACLYGTCGDIYAAFLATEHGYQLETCIKACPVDDSACDQTCYDAYPASMDAYMKFAECLAVACRGKC